MDRRTARRVDEFKAHVRTFHAVFPHVLSPSGPAATASTCSARTSRWRSTTRRSMRSSPGPGVLERHLVGLRLAGRRPSTAGRKLIHGLAWIATTTRSTVHRRRAAHHRRSPAAGVLPPPSADLALRHLSDARRAACLRQPLGSNPATGEPPRLEPAHVHVPRTPLRPTCRARPAARGAARDAASPAVPDQRDAAVRRAAAHPLDPGRTSGTSASSATSC